jgi:hypothetical protein
MKHVNCTKSVLYWILRKLKIFVHQPVRYSVHHFAIGIFMLLPLLGGFFSPKGKTAKSALPAVAGCDDLIIGSLDGDCEIDLTVNMVLEGDVTGCPGPWTVVVRFGVVDTLAVRTVATPSSVATVVGAYDYVGDTLQVDVYDNAGVLCCASGMLVEDRLAPRLTCRDTTINCGVDTSPVSTGFPLVLENCDPDFRLSYVDSVGSGNCADSIYLRISRKWRSSDASGNVDSCTQQIRIRRGLLGMVGFPPPDTLICSGVNLNPLVTGRPTLIGRPIGSLCNLSVAPPRDTTTIFCAGGKYLVSRRWVVSDVCNSNLRDSTQLLLVIDTLAPVITCTDTIRLGTDPTKCTATVILDPSLVNVSDDCSTSPTLTVDIPGVGTGFGPHLNVTPGTYNVFFRATDCSDLTSQCRSVLIVEDDEEPVAICREFTVVSLNSTGRAIVAASVFNEGSYDNCDNVGFLVSRDGVNFRDTVGFDCSHAGQDSIMVILRVYEQRRPDVYDQCMVFVEVQDKLKPLISCPPGTTVDCGFDFSNLSQFGQPILMEACGYTLRDTTIFRLNSCGVGTVERIFTATDPSGNVATCTQVIRVENLTPFNGSAIQWPRDTTFNTCGPAISPDDLPAPYGKPTFPREDCALLATTYDDQRFDFSAPACFKVFRTWKVIDWCTNQQWQYTQKIIVMDNTPPQLTCPGNKTVAANKQCGPTYVSIAPAGFTDCDPNVVVTHDSPYADAQGRDASGTYPVGTTVVKFTAKDKCGNVRTCSSTIVVTDLTPPTIKIIDRLALELIGFNGVVESKLEPQAFDAGISDNCTPKNNLRFTIRKRNPAATTPPTATSLIYTCADIGTDTVEVWVTDAAGNADYAVGIVDIQDNMQRCASVPRPSISGQVKNRAGQPMPGVQVYLQGSTPALTTTDADGIYKFSNLQAGGDYTVMPQKDNDLLDGVTTFDLVMLSKHILNQGSLSSPQNLIAGDANSSSSISTMDMIAIRKVILRLEQKFPNTPSWRFLETGYRFTDPGQPFGQPLPCVRTFSSLRTSVAGADFEGVKTGDVNGNATGNATTVNPRERLPEQIWTLSDRVVSAGEVFEVAIAGKMAAVQLTGFQMALRYPAEQLEIVGVEAANGIAGSAENLGFHVPEPGTLLVNWYDARGTAIAAGEPVIRLRCKALGAGQLSKMISIGPSALSPEAYDASGKMWSLTLEFDRQANEAAPGFELLQNVPNPFDRGTTIGFELGEPCRATLKVTDFAGRLVKVLEGDYPAGKHEIRITQKDLPQPGMYFYQLDTPRYTAVKKMILL